MRVIGQPHIMGELEKLLPKLYSNRDMSVNLLFRGKSGYGKTRLALLTANFLERTGNFSLSVGTLPQVIDERKRVYVIDEVHLVKEPEFLFPYMDSGKYVFILASNEATTLREELVNRCYSFIFSEYTNDELRLMLREAGNHSLPNSYLDYVIECGGGNPRIILSLARRVRMIIDPERVTSLDAFKEFMKLSLGYQDGLDTLSRRYVEILRSIGGTASLDTLSGLLHIDKDTLKYQVEPILLYKNLIKINSKGRNLV